MAGMIPYCSIKPITTSLFFQGTHMTMIHIMLVSSHYFTIIYMDLETAWTRSKTATPEEVTRFASQR